jgi:DNA-binding NtrC family response regulator
MRFLPQPDFRAVRDYFGSKISPAMLITGKTLFAFVDPKDPFMPSPVAGEEQPGPILSILSARRFAFLFLFFTPHTRSNAESARREVEKRYPDCQVRLHEILVSDPKDYSSLMGKLAREVREIVRTSRSVDNSVCVSSGTAEMRAAWFLLIAVGVLPATLLQVGSPAKPLFGPANVKEVRTDTDSWSTLRDLVMPVAYFGSDLHLLGRRRALIEGTHRQTRSESRAVERPGAEITESRSVFASLAPGCRWESLAGEVVTPHPHLDEVLQEIGIVVTSAALRFAVERAATAATAAVPVLLLGETGTGKELFARLVHRLSERADKPMVAVNCAAIPKDLAESHLFGHTKGAFTGAHAPSKGVFGRADGGTVFLDEIGELPLEIQAKLLRVLEQGNFTQLGTATETKVDVRVIAATNRNLEQQVAAKYFRQDLYYRLNVARVELPSLRSRRSDVRQLAAAFLERINQRRSTPASLSKDALNRLEKYDWPGNVRELLNVLDSSVLFAKTAVLGPDDLIITASDDHADPLAYLPDPVEGFSIEAYLGQVRKQLFLRALQRSGGNQAQAAKLLDVSKQAISNFLKGEAVNAG